MKVVGIIPARYKSTRFEGKPLADICGKPMIWWVYNQCRKVKELDELYVATDDVRIEKICNDLNINVIMTSPKHKTGTDRIGEVATIIKADVYVNIQGDEPLIEPESIKKVIDPFYNNEKKIFVTNGMTEIKKKYEIVDNTVPKVVTNKESKGIFLSRMPIPYPKGDDCIYYKQVCVYGFTPKALEFFCNHERGKIEKIEDIEILRFIENGYDVQFVEVENDTIAVDTIEDLKRVNKILEEREI